MRVQNCLPSFVEAGRIIKSVLSVLAPAWLQGGEVLSVFHENTEDPVALLLRAEPKMPA